MLSMNPTVAAASSLTLRTGMFAVMETRCVAATPSVKGTGLSFGMSEGHRYVPTADWFRPFIGTGALVSALGIDVMGADQVQVKADTVRIPAAADQGTPPRRKPPRC